jgi:hypothetical protein
MRPVIGYRLAGAVVVAGRRSHGRDALGDSDGHAPPNTLSSQKPVSTASSWMIRLTSGNAARSRLL